jgi:hypothetical protein
MGHEGSLPFSHDAATGPYPAMNPIYTFHFSCPNFHFNIILPVTPRSSELSLSDFPKKVYKFLT